MVDKVDPRTGELTTANYGWVKPTVGASVDAWGGYINTDLDGIDSTVKSVSTVANAAYPASNPNGYQTAGQVTTSLGSYLPLTGGTLSGNLIIGNGSGSAYLGFNTASGANFSAFSGQVLGTNRWNINLTGVPTETGTGNTGSDFNIIPYTDTGVQLSPALTIKRSSGLATVVADPITPLGVATKQYVDAHGGINDNRIINGDMRIDQRNNGASGTVSGYTVDRWQFISTQAAKGTWQRVASNMPGFPYCLAFNSLSAYALLAADYFAFRQLIEADQISDFQWGTANAQPVTLSFWASSTLTGTFSGCISNFAGTRSYPFTYTISAANTNTRIAVTIPGDTGGTWVMSGNGGGAIVYFDLGCGSTNRGPASVWASAAYMGVTGAVSVVATNSATFYVTGVKLEIGSVATPYNRQSLAKSMIDCQRYYGRYNFDVNVYGVAGGVFSTYVSFTSMRSAPTMATIGSPTFGGITGGLGYVPYVSGGKIYVSVGATGGCFITGVCEAAAEL